MSRARLGLCVSRFLLLPPGARDNRDERFFVTRGATPHPPCFADASPSAQDERDALLYHILTQQPGLVIVFVNAISALRRLLSLLKILQLPVEGLHGNMQQRARLKYLDRFRAAALSEGTNESSAASVGSGPRRRRQARPCSWPRTSPRAA